jgi:hypothetical protein
VAVPRIESRPEGTPAGRGNDRVARGSGSIPVPSASRADRHAGCASQHELRGDAEHLRRFELQRIDRVAHDGDAFMTNGAGNGEGDAKISPAEADGLRGHTLYVQWSLTSATSTYRTACSRVVLD